MYTNSRVHSTVQKICEKVVAQKKKKSAYIFKKKCTREGEETEAKENGRENGPKIVEGIFFAANNADLKRQGVKIKKPVKSLLKAIKTVFCARLYYLWKVRIVLNNGVIGKRREGTFRPTRPPSLSHPTIVPLQQSSKTVFHAIFPATGTFTIRNSAAGYTFSLFLYTCYTHTYSAAICSTTDKT